MERPSRDRQPQSWCDPAGASPAQVRSSVRRRRMRGPPRLTGFLTAQTISNTKVRDELSDAELVTELHRVGRALPLCIENFVCFDCVRESHNVGDYGCATLLLSRA